MFNYKKPFFFFLTLLLLCNKTLCFGQQFSTSELFEFYEKAETKEKKIAFAKAFLELSKKENSTKKIHAGYYILASQYDNEIKLSYLDSIIDITKNNPTKHQPAIAYNAKAIYLQRNGEHERALDNYILSNKFSSLAKNESLYFLNNFNLGTIKRFIGEYEESLKLFRKCLTFTKKELKNSRYSGYYLKTIISISNAFYELKNIDSATYYNKLGVLESIKYKSLSSYHHLAFSQGIIHYFSGEENIAIDSINKHKSYFIENKDSVNLSYAYYYLAKIYADKGLVDKAANHYKKVDSLMSFTSDLTPKFRGSYVFLINHFKKENDLKNQLLYINRLKSFDSIINPKINYLSKVIFKEYDIPKLKVEKASIKKHMQNKLTQSKLVIASISILLLITLIFLIHQYRTRKKYKTRFKQIINSENIIKDSLVLPIKKEINIPEKIVTDILNKLEDFEKNNKFILNSITLNSLASEFNTNTNYLSKIINHYKKTTFSSYINTLRIEYILTEIKNNPILRNFTIKALAEEAGFNNSESFSKAFLKSKGIKPSYFLKELEKIEKKTNS